jgi:hypothetical protein
MEYEISANPSSPGYDYVPVGPDVPVFAQWAHRNSNPVQVNQESADAIAAWLAKYDSWPESMVPVSLHRSTGRSSSPP